MWKHTPTLNVLWSMMDAAMQRVAVQIPVHSYILLAFRNGVVLCESIVKFRNKLEELGPKKGVNQDKKG